MYPNLQNKTLSDNINKPYISPKTHTETQVVELLEGDLLHKNVIRSFVYHNEVLIVLAMQNTIPEKKKKDNMKAIEIEFTQNMNAYH